MADQPAKELPPLGDLEHEVMQLIWARGPATADRVRKMMPRRLKDATIRTVLRRLEEKGYVTHTVDGRTFIYGAVEARKEVAAKAVKRIIDWFCEGSLEELLTGMVDSALLDRKQLLALAAKLDPKKNTR
jgi:BlaI family penicillinase repressor